MSAVDKLDALILTLEKEAKGEQEQDEKVLEDLLKLTPEEEDLLEKKEAVLREIEAYGFAEKARKAMEKMSPEEYHATLEPKSDEWWAFYDDDSNWEPYWPVYGYTKSGKPL